MAALEKGLKLESGEEARRKKESELNLTEH